MKPQSRWSRLVGSIAAATMSACSGAQIYFTAFQEGTPYYALHPWQQDADARYPSAVGYIPLNERLEVRDWKQGYVKVRWREQTGWVSKDKIKPEKSFPVLFVAAGPPIRFYEIADLRSRVVFEADQNAEVHIEACAPYADKASFSSNTHWCLARTAGGQGWVDPRGLVREKLILKFHVAAYNGLNIRQGPGLQHPVRSTMPHRAQGIVFRRDAKEETIDGKRGFWFLGQWEGREGWIFSGFAYLGYDLKDFETTISIDEAFKELNLPAAHLKEMHPDEVQEIFRDYQSEPIDTRYYTIFKMRHRGPESCTQNKTATVLFLHKKKGVYFNGGGGIATYITNLDFPFPSTVMSVTHHCLCCCPWTSGSTYFLMRDKIAVTSLALSDLPGPGKCTTGMFATFLNGGDFRTLDEKRILGRLFLPDCEETWKQNSADLNGTTVAALRSRHEMFVSITFDPDANFLEILRFLDQGVPESHRAAWDRGRKLPGPKSYPRRESVLLRPMFTVNAPITPPVGHAVGCDLESGRFAQ